MENHYHYEINGYEKIIEENMALMDSCSIIVLAKNEQEAIENAKKMVKKKFYRIAKSWECLEEHGVQADLQMLQIELQKKMLDIARGKL